MGNVDYAPPPGMNCFENTLEWLGLIVKQIYIIKFLVGRPIWASIMVLMGIQT